MTFFKSTIYKALCYTHVLILAAFLVIALYSKLFLGWFLYYGRVDERNIGHESLFNLLMLLFYGLIISIILWGSSTVVMIINGKYNLLTTSKKIGIIGFIVGVVVLYLDPFGLAKWLND